jgi:hypothetical protein
LLFLMRRHEEPPAPMVPSPGVPAPVVTIAPAARKALAYSRMAPANGAALFRPDPMLSGRSFRRQ